MAEYLVTFTVQTKRAIGPGMEAELEDQIASALDENLPKRYDVLNVQVSLLERTMVVRRNYAKKS